jgi:hypothetical protein
MIYDDEHRKKYGSFDEDEICKAEDSDEYDFDKDLDDDRNKDDK